MTSVTTVRSVYDQIASEYYDASLHPTCANFRELSKPIVGTWLSGRPRLQGLTCEIGAGKSLLAELMAESGVLDETSPLLIDSSLPMLSHSAEYARYGATPLIADAAELPIRQRSVAHLVAVLGDSYNSLQCLREFERVLSKDGEVIFTTPSYEWASNYRLSAGDRVNEAVFSTHSGGTLAVPSVILPQEEQLVLFRHAGLKVSRIWHMGLDDLAGTSASPRFKGIPDGVPVITGYSLTRAAS